MKLSRGRLAIIIIVGIIVLVAIITPIAYFASRSSNKTDDKPAETGTETERLDCYPEARSPAVVLTREVCELRGCVFDSSALSGGGVACYYPKSGGLRYQVESRENLPNGFKVQLRRLGPSPFSQDFRKPSLEVQKLSNVLLRFTFDDDYATPKRYRVPLDLTLPATGADNPLYDVAVSSTNNLALKITRKSTGKVIFDTEVGGLVLSDQFLQITTRLPSRNIYGLGENVHDTFRHQLNLSWPAFARDQPAGGHLNHYGVHPFYTCLEDENGNTHGVFMLNSNAQEYAFTPDPTITFRTLGGVLDFFVFLGPSSENVVQQYTGLIGRPVFPPYWALGFQLCRYGYDSLQNLQRAVNETLYYNIPLDVQYADIDHMEEQRIFTVDSKNFGGLNRYFESLRAGGMHTIIILDPCVITNVTNYEPYERMKQVRANIVWPSDFTVPANSSDEDGSILGYVWPVGKVVFPDFFKNHTRQVWKELIVNHRNVLVFDGLWIDMNEPANFGTNEERPWNWPEYAKPYWSLHCGNNTWDDPPYRPLAAYAYDSKDRRALLSDKTLCMNAVQGERGEFRHYDVHSLYGWSQTAPTLDAARAATGERSIVISRSTFPGSGKHAGHWLGDNTSAWKHLRDSIIGMMEFNLFGMPYIGADICGFFENTTYELCHRWMQLGAFYPFCRNHNGKGYIEQHPGVFGQSLLRPHGRFWRPATGCCLTCTHSSTRLTVKAELLSDHCIMSSRQIQRHMGLTDSSCWAQLC
ncbi:maltase-glucoamylase, intestinal-like [Pomacea canaliculata]|uniref:maltase-glucoamylase, intestinal-like n=1 Tax=Pomacea canaliculata TaxID=400727 RepID=UPI000D725CDF|nr:maltase-glucoamylase, intestinal-like [Pomacea canaliculata]